MNWYGFKKNDTGYFSYRLFNPIKVAKKKRLILLCNECRNIRYASFRFEPLVWRTEEQNYGEHLEDPGAGMTMTKSSLHLDFLIDQVPL